MAKNCGILGQDYIGEMMDRMDSQMIDNIRKGWVAKPYKANITKDWLMDWNTISLSQKIDAEGFLQMEKELRQSLISDSIRQREFFRGSPTSHRDIGHRVTTTKNTIVSSVVAGSMKEKQDLLRKQAILEKQRKRRGLYWNRSTKLGSPLWKNVNSDVS